MIPTLARERIKIDRTDKIYYGSSIALVLLSILVYTYPEIQLVQQVYEEQELRMKKREPIAEQNMLRLRYEMLISPDEMEERAKFYGYREPSVNQVLYVRKK